MRRCDSENRVKIPLPPKYSETKCQKMLALKSLKAQPDEQAREIVAEDFGTFFLDQIKARL